MKNPVFTLIKQLGGATAVAAHLTEVSGQTVNKNAVYQWPHLGAVPYRWRKSVELLAKQKRVKLPDDYWTARPDSTGDEARQ